MKSAMKAGADAQFKEFVDRQQKKVVIDNVLDWHKEREDWLHYLRELYSRIAEYLNEYIEVGAIKLSESLIELNEEDIGTYKAMRLTIVIGGQEITLTPIGTNLIGSKGRVDVKGSAGTSRLVLINARAGQMIRAKVTTVPRGAVAPASESPPAPKHTEWVWKIVSRPPAMQFIELNKESLFQMLMEVSNG
jgi:hypothetical protein